MKKSRPGRHGMTLIELMTVMLIIGILVALLLPATIKMRNHAREAKEKTLRLAFINAVLNYHAESGEWPVTPQPAAPTEYLSKDVIDKLRDNPGKKLFWEGDDAVKTASGQEYWLRINPQGKYPIAMTNEFGADYTVSVDLK